MKPEQIIAKLRDNGDLKNIRKSSIDQIRTVLSVILDSRVKLRCSEISKITDLKKEQVSGRLKYLLKKWVLLVSWKGMKYIRSVKYDEIAFPWKIDFLIDKHLWYLYDDM